MKLNLAVAWQDLLSVVREGHPIPLTVGYSRSYATHVCHAVPINHGAIGHFHRRFERRAAIRTHYAAGTVESSYIRIFLTGSSSRARWRFDQRVETIAMLEAQCLGAPAQW